MLGKSAKPRALLLFVGLVACAHNVAQDSATGADGKSKSAKAITLENGEGKAKGIVTYPGGDRVDWKLVELPDKVKGQLDIKLTWTPPRPGLQLAFDVFNEWNEPLVTSKSTSKKRSKGRLRTATLEHVKGKYYIRVYAVGRGDAGKYNLTVDFKEDSAIIGFDPTKIDVQDPPKLAEIPPPEVACDELQFDPKNPSCRGICPAMGAPPNWPPCAGKCPTPPDASIPSCQTSMACPVPPDRRVRACKLSAWPSCDIKNPDPGNPKCDNATAEPVVARVIKNEVQGGDTLVTISAGTEQGVGPKGWKGRLLKGDTDGYLDGGEVSIIRVGKRDTLGKVHLPTDVISQNPKVKLTPPPKGP